MTIVLSNSNYRPLRAVCSEKHNKGWSWLMRQATWFLRWWPFGSHTLRQNNTRNNVYHSRWPSQDFRWYMTVETLQVGVLNLYSVDATFKPRQDQWVLRPRTFVISLRPPQTPRTYLDKTIVLNPPLFITIPFDAVKGYILTFWRQNYFFNFSTPCI